LPTDAGIDQKSAADGPSSDVLSPPVTVCSPDNWCWDHPSPQGKNMFGVWGTSETNVFAVAEGGTIFRYDGVQWTLSAVSTKAALRGIWGAGPSAVFAVGGAGTILHYDGQSWSAMASNATTDLNGVFGTSPTNVYAVGKKGAVRRFNGTIWTTPVLLTTDFNAIWGSGPSDLFLVGKGGAIAHFDGTNWTAMISPVTDDLNAVWGSGPTDVHAVGDFGTIVHYDGSKWTKVGGSIQSLKAVWGRSASEVYAAGTSGELLCSDGKTWQHIWVCWPNVDQSVLPKDDLYGLWGTGTNTVLVVGEAGTLIRYTAGQHQRAPISKVTTQELRGIGGAVASELYAVGWSSTMLRKELGAWNQVKAVTSAMAPILTDVVSFAANDILAIGFYCEILHYDGVTWTKQPDWFGPGCHVYYSPVIWSSGQGQGFLLSSSSDEAFFVGPGKTHVINKLPTGEQNEGIWGTDFNNVYLVSTAGGNYGVSRWDGMSWSTMPGFPQYTQGKAIWGSSSTDIFVLAAQNPQGRIVHYNGSKWTTIDTGANAVLRRIWGSGPSDVYVVVQDGSVVRYDGSVWKPMDTGVNRLINDVWGLGPNEVYLVGENGAILRRSSSSAP
jgi:hypothetical protein